MIKIMVSVLIILSFLTGCVANPEVSDPDPIEASDPDQIPDSPTVIPEASEEYTIPNGEISQMFINALHESGFDLEMDQQKYEIAAKTVMLPNGQSLFENGYLYKFENLKGEEYAYGQNGAVISLNTSATNDGEIFDTYQLYVNSALGGISLPGGLSFGSSFEDSLKNLGAYHAYQTQKSDDNDDVVVELYNENDERLFVVFAGWHGATIDDSLENVYANLNFEKKQNEDALFCSLYYAGGKLYACEYSARIKNNTLTEDVSHDRITAHFYQLQINMDNITGTIDTVAFDPGSIELTVTIKSSTGEKETIEYYLEVWYSADAMGMLGPFSFEAEEYEKTQTSTYKDPGSSRQNDYFEGYLDFGEQGFFAVYNGGIYYDTSMSR